MLVLKYKPSLNGYLPTGGDASFYEACGALSMTHFTQSSFGAEPAARVAVLVSRIEVLMVPNMIQGSVADNFILFCFSLSAHR